jgi:hypothetical protein
VIGRFGGSLCASSGTPSQPQTLWRWSQGNVERMTQKEVPNRPRELNRAAINVPVIANIGSDDGLILSRANSCCRIEILGNDRHQRLLACNSLASRPGQLEDSAMNMSWILIAVLTFLVVLVVFSYIVEALRSAPKRPETLVWAPRIPIEYVDLGGIRVRCIKTGVGPNLVLLHTLRTQLDMFQKIISELAKHFTVHAFDYPGTAGRTFRKPHTRPRISTNGPRRTSTRSILGKRQSSASRSAERSRWCWRRARIRA